MYEELWIKMSRGNHEQKLTCKEELFLPQYPEYKGSIQFEEL